MGWQALAAAGAQAGMDLTGGFVNINQSEIARQFNREMSSTEYQRMVQDLRKAGLNPLMALGGGGAGGGSSPIAQWGGSHVGESINSAVRGEQEGKRLNLETALNKEAVAKMQAETEATRIASSAKQAEQALIQAQTRRTEQGILLDAQNARLSGANARTLELQFPKRELASEGWKGLSNVLGGEKPLSQRLGESFKGTWDWITGKSERGSPSDAYSRGAGNVYGGANSARFMERFKHQHASQHMKSH